MESFKTRVNNFWKAFCHEEEGYRRLLDEKRHQELIENLTGHLDEVMPIAFELGKSDTGVYELALTGEGDNTKCFLTNYWVKQAPGELLSTWNFYSARPRSRGNFGIRMLDRDVALEDIFVYPSIQKERAKIDIAVFSKKLAGLDRNEKYSLLFVCLDAAIGETYTECYIGEIEILDSKKLLTKSITMAELYQYIEEAIAANSWNRFENPCEVYSGYQVPPRENPIRLREDILFGGTAGRDTLKLYQNDDTWLTESEKWGVAFGFLFYDNSGVPREKVVEYRAAIEDEVLALLTDSQAAQILGGATGSQNSYIDFILYDEDEFLDIMQAWEGNKQGIRYRNFREEAAVISL